ncbi:hypothetical protein HK103_000613 [Boothiomyces macroporosus]|uniref:Uncharacterized protein n=1 Tax=Boothiomyces macroporosus TaxID=261099 RepID=A0AAD5UPR2_9FUNG|nr:hypothetical protein HK103_000613 [Boothiomyces macroporosus]KAJ3315285.1 hypothetical protein HDV04_003678 [Boothiomyces sp. JEL0838]
MDTSTQRLATSSTSISNLYKTSSRDALSKKKVPGVDKPSAQSNALAYKLKKQLEGEESEREPDLNGILKWRWSKKETTEIYSLNFSPDSAYLAATGGQGNIYIYSTFTNQKEFTLVPDLKVFAPCTSVAFRPDNKDLKNKNVLGATYSDGSIRHWHATSGQLMSTIEGDDVQLHHIAYSSSGLTFVTSRSDDCIRVYDANTNHVIYNGKTMEEKGNIGHSNRVFCAKFHPKDSNFIISGGWDNNLLIWDIRKPNPVRSIFGPHICGDAIDFNDSGSTILTGSYTRDQSIQLWDWQTGSLIKSVNWNSDPEIPACLLYSAVYSKGTAHSGDMLHQRNRFVLAGGSGLNEVRLFSTESFRVVGSVEHLNCAVYTVAISNDDNLIALAGGGKMVMLLELDEQIETTK